MKQTLKLILSTFILLFSISSCKKDDNSSSATPTPVINTVVVQGTWKITLYSSNGTDETNHYSGYSFLFNSNGTVTATKASTSVSGTWSSANDDSKLKLVLNFGTAAPFQELNSDWHILQQDASIVKLDDVSGGGGGTDYLSFEKI